MEELELHVFCLTPGDPLCRQWVYFPLILLKMIGNYDKEIIAAMCMCVRVHQSWSKHTHFQGSDHVNYVHIYSSGLAQSWAYGRSFF